MADVTEIGISLGAREPRARARNACLETLAAIFRGATTGSAGAAPRIASRSRPLRPRSRRNRPAFLPEGSPSSGWDFSVTSPGTPRTSWRRRYDDTEATRVSRLRGWSPLALYPDRAGSAARSAPSVSCLFANETRLLPNPSLVTSKRRAGSGRKKRFQSTPYLERVSSFASADRAMLLDQELSPEAVPTPPRSPSSRPPHHDHRAQATSAHLNGEPDWGVNVDMCDLVNSNFARHGKDCVKALKLKIMKKSAPDRQMLALIAFEMCMKNCGQDFHLMAIAKDVPHEMARLTAAAGVAEEVHEKTLTLIREWAQQIRHPHLQDVYDHVRSKGVRFPRSVLASDGRGAEADPTDGPFGSPAVSAAAAQPLYTPRATTAEIISANLEKMDPLDAAAIRAAVAEAEAEAEVMERAERAGEALGSPPSPRRGGGVDFGGRAGVLRRDDGMPLNFDRPGAIPPRARSRARRRAATRRWRRKRRGDREVGTRRTTGTLPTCSRRSAPPPRKPRARARRLSRPRWRPRTCPRRRRWPLKHDLAVAGETVESLRTALAAIDVERDPGAAAAGPVARLAEQCRQMKPRVVALVESATDEGLLMAALALHDELGDVLDRRDAIAAAAAAEPEMRAALAASLAEEAARLALREGERGRRRPRRRRTPWWICSARRPRPSSRRHRPSTRRWWTSYLPPKREPLGEAQARPAAEKGKPRRRCRTRSPGTLRRVGGPRRRRGTPPTRAASAASGSSSSRNRGYRATARTRICSRRRRRRDLRRPAPETRTLLLRGARPARGGGERSGRLEPARGAEPRRRGVWGGPDASRVRARRARYRTRSSTRGTVRRARRWSEVRVRRAAAPSDSSPAPVPARPAADGDPFAALAEAARSPEKNPLAIRGSETRSELRVTARRWSVGEPSDVSSWGLGRAVRDM